MAAAIGIDLTAFSGPPTLLEVLLRQPQPPSPDFALSPLLPPGAPALGASDPALRSTGAWQGRAVGVLSSLTGAALRAEYGWATHLGLSMVVASAQPFARCQGPEEEGAPLAGSEQALGVDARALNSLLAAEDGPMLCLRLPLCAEGGSGSGRDAARWRAWNALRTLCGHNLQLGLCLEVGRHLPSPLAVQRWLAEPARLALLPTALFVPNAAGFPSLLPPHQALVQALVGAGCALALTGPAPPAALEAALAATLAQVRSGAVPGDAAAMAALAAAPALAYLAYLRHLAACRPAPSPYEADLARWQHALMAPLQPLAHNLPSATYEVFERDGPKYEAYQAAIAAALRDRMAAAAPTPPALRVLVIGAGRGPLVARALAAAGALGCALALVALEKNPHAFLQLQALAQAEGWGECGVALVQGDVRDYAAAHAAAAGQPFDLLVSELLGSFGDNELSPECLSAALPLLAPRTGVCIPCAYTSYLAPITCPGLWGAAQRALLQGTGADRVFVTRMPRALALAPPSPVFTFAHQAGSGTSSSSSSGSSGSSAGDATLTAEVAFCTRALGAALPALLHGFAGYFSAELYPGVGLSTLPASHTPGMHSWFPLFVPLRAPVAVAAGGAIALSMWRCREGGRVWYEWALRQPCAQGLQNAGGQSWDMKC